MRRINKVAWRWASVCGCALVLLSALIGDAGADELKIGGTGAALGTMRLLAKEFSAKHPEIQIKIVPNLGSGGGIKAVLGGAIDLALSSRPLTEEERQLGATENEYGRTPLVFAMAAKASTNAITRAEMAEIYAGTRVKWPDGSPIRVILRPTSDIDSDMVKSISPALRQGVAMAEQRPGVRIALNDQIAADDLERVSGAVGPSTLSLIISERRGLKALRLDDISPLRNGTANPTYPYFKRLFFVTGTNRAAIAQEFTAFVNSPSGRKILVANGHWLP